MSSTSNSQTSSSPNRSHNQGRQDRGYTQAQQAAVNRVRKCKQHDFYAVLDIEASASDGEVRKAYRKLALIMHPDKNGAPGADEAFKTFQVLSDPDKKRIYDQTGSDPDSRGGVPSRSGAGTGAGGGTAGAELSPEDLFNIFFGGGNGAFHTQFGNFGPGIRIGTFGGGSPFNTFRAQRPGMGRRPPPNQEENFSGRNILQLLPLLLLFLVAVLSSIFGDSSNGYNDRPTKFEFQPAQPYVMERVTPHHHIPYFVNPKDISKLTERKLSQLDREAEISYVRLLRNMCNNEHEEKERKINESYGWFSVDKKKYDEAMKMKLPSCDRLTELGFAYQRY